jgi:hypothetical protein
MARGFIFTMDSLIAFGLALAVLGLVIPFYDTTSMPNHEQLHVQRYTADLLSVMQKTGQVRGAIAGDGSSIVATLSNTGAGKCFVFKAVNATTSAVVITVSKPGCGGAQMTVSSAASNEYYAGGFYRLELSGWVE